MREFSNDQTKKILQKSNKHYNIDMKNYINAKHFSSVLYAGNFAHSMNRNNENFHNETEQFICNQWNILLYSITLINALCIIYVPVYIIIHTVCLLTSDNKYVVLIYKLHIKKRIISTLIVFKSLTPLKSKKIIWRLPNTKVQLNENDERRQMRFSFYCCEYRP